MWKTARIAGAAALSCAAVGGVAACGSSSSGSTAVKEGGTATVLMGTAPDYLDPQEGYTTQSAEATWISYTPLLTYRHASGSQGTQLIPGLAKALPAVSKDGRTYTLTLRPNLVFSNGKPVRASDFKATIERAIKLNWGGKSFFTNYIEGASAFDSGKSDTISGIQADDATGRITIHLTEPYGAFANVLAFPAAGITPAGTAQRNLSNDPPPGVGPYTIKDVSPNRTFSLVKNPRFAGLNIPDIPTGHLDRIKVDITSNTQSEAEQVLQDQADAFDAGDTLPPSLLPQIESKAQGRFAREPVPSTFYFFMNTRTKPFDNPLARQAVEYALDRRAFVRLASGFLKPECYFLPEGIAGHPTGSCPYGSRDGAPDLAKAKQLVKEAGLDGTPVTVWGETRSPRQQYVEYYTSVLNKIGFKATPKIVSDSVYFPTIGNAASNPQTGFADWIQDFPNPSDFYLLMDARTIQPTNNENFSMVDDPHVQGELTRLNGVPATRLDSVAGDWRSLDEYTAKKAYVAVYGSEEVPKFLSNRIDFGSAVFHPLYLNDWSTWQLKK
ncbi:MAG TPA: ABC transporter substrate-binding protein [Thermoleophilaceae bacterium]|jgi:peptide/nickel transport system substrate-binding protein